MERRLTAPADTAVAVTRRETYCLSLRSAAVTDGDGTTTLDVVTWNLDRPPVARFREQLDALATVGPDLLALQELGRRTSERCRDLLQSAGYPHVVIGRTVRDRRPTATDVLLASRHPLEPLDPQPYDGPRSHRVVAAKAGTQMGPVTVHGVHVVPGSQDGWTKARMLDGLVDAMRATDPADPAIFCGDCNAPRAERDGTIVPFEDPAAGAAERRLLGPNADHDLVDAYRAVAGADEAYSFETDAGDRYRFDHVLASPAFVPSAATYRHDYDGLSDHTPLHVQLVVGDDSRPLTAAE